MKTQLKMNVWLQAYCERHTHQEDSVIFWVNGSQITISYFKDNHHGDVNILAATIWHQADNPIPVESTPLIPIILEDEVVNVVEWEVLMAFIKNAMDFTEKTSTWSPNLNEFFDKMIQAGKEDDLEHSNASEAWASMPVLELPETWLVRIVNTKNPSNKYQEQVYKHAKEHWHGCTVSHPASAMRYIRSEIQRMHLEHKRCGGLQVNDDLKYHHETDTLHLWIDGLLTLSFYKIGKLMEGLPLLSWEGGEND